MSSVSTDVFGRAVQHIKYALPEGIGNVIASDLRERDRIGRETYGVSLMSHNGREPLVDLYEELLDSLVYSVQHDIESGRSMKSDRTAQIMVLLKGVATELLYETGKGGMLAGRPEQPLPTNGEQDG